MKKDRIERFIRDNREAFDSHEPSPDVWARLERQLGDAPDGSAPPEDTPPTGRVIDPVFQSTPRRLNSLATVQRYWIAATVVLVMGLLGWWALRPSARVTTDGDTELASIDPQAAQAAYRYASLIETKRQEIKQLQQTDPELYKDFSTEIEDLNKDYQRLKAELPKTPNQEDLLKAMIQNLQTQVDILNRQLSILQRVNSAKQHHETTI